MSARRRVEHVFALYAAGATTWADPPLRYYRLDERVAVVVDLPVHLTFRVGGRPRYAHALPDIDEDRSGFTLVRTPDLHPAERGNAGWWMRRDSMHCRQQAHFCWASIDDTCLGGTSMGRCHG